MFQNHAIYKLKTDIALTHKELKALYNKIDIHDKRPWPILLSTLVSMVNQSAGLMHQFLTLNGSEIKWIKSIKRDLYADAKLDTYASFSFAMLGDALERAKTYIKSLECTDTMSAVRDQLLDCLYQLREFIGLITCSYGQLDEEGYFDNPPEDGITTDIRSSPSILRRMA